MGWGEIGYSSRFHSLREQPSGGFSIVGIIFIAAIFLGPVLTPDTCRHMRSPVPPPLMSTRRSGRLWRGRFPRTSSYRFVILHPLIY